MTGMERTAIRADVSRVSRCAISVRFTRYERQVDYLRQGLRLTTDTIHQNTAGAGLIAGLIEDFVAAASEE
ncbi:hypothetical protein AB0E63_05480 [Kribbella sp. NPDC026596]|uniref:hypothetical protein n=1 Tax=Kribbella sp. NPDC026596 TaxID=3155122 RepID=UPI0033F0BB3C